MSSIAERFAHLSPLQQAYLALEQAQSRLDGLERARHEPIAIVGIGCRFPGGDGPQEFWRVLRDGLDMVIAAPADRWDSRLVEQTLHGLSPGAAPTVQAAFLNQVDQFDAAFFGISPREASSMDPQQRLLLEVVWDALDNAGLAAERLAGSKTGVFVGVHSQSSDYYWMQAGGASHVDAFTATGTAHSVVAGRVSYVLDLRGPSVALDTACSSSLVAVHLASQSLRSGECDLTFAGGVNVRLSPEFLFATVQMGTASPSGRCRAFDAAADGIVFGEGCGIVVLKRLSDAMRDGDAIWALVRGSAVNQDGRSAGLAAPNGLAQQAVIRAALENAGAAAAEIDFIEAHGTGTPLGDPIEIEALAEVFGPARADGSPCAIGSIKTNIGHLEGAAGIAGLIKTVLALHHGAIPPSLHLRSLNPHIALNGAPLVFPTELRPWPAGARRRLAGVSSFGWSGTNAHIVLEEAPSQPVKADSPRELDRGLLLPLSARSSEALRSLAGAYRTLLASNAAADDICYSAGARRSHHAHRLAAAGRSRDDLVARLDEFLARGDTGEKPGAPAPQSKLVFVFPGQGGQWAGMGRTLLESEPAFRAALDECYAALRPYLARPLGELLADPQAAWLTEIDQLQPVLFALQVALAALWRAWGVVPDAVVGHSLGEIAAAYVAGALSLAEAARVIGIRSRLLRRLQGQGAMVLVELPAAAAEAAIAGVVDQVALAAVNGPRSSVLAGERAALGQVVARLEAQGVFCRWVKVEVAAHSPQVDPLRGELMAALAELQPRPPAIPFYSTVTVTGEALPLDGAYWARNLRAPVRFWEAVERLAADGHTVFLELSPHPTLAPNIEQGLRQLGRPGTALVSLRREQPERAELLSTLASLYTLGTSIDWSGLYPAGGRFARLPAYPWQRERFWLLETQAGIRRVMSTADATGHPLLGRRLDLSTHPDVRIWEYELTIAARPYLADHQVQGETVLPATAYLELAAAAAAETFGDDKVVLERINFRRVLIVPKEPALTLQVALTVAAPDTATFQIASRTASGDAATWTIHADGYIRHNAPRVPVQPDTPLAVQERCGERMTGAELYAAMELQGLQYGERFRGVEQIWRREGEAIGAIRLPAALAGESSRDLIHPALLDACLQVMAAAIPRQRNGEQHDTFLPAGAQSVWMPGNTGARLWSHARLTTKPEADNDLVAYVDVYAEDGHLAGSLHGVELQRVDVARRAAEAPAALSAWLHELRWVPAPVIPPAETVRSAHRPSTWLILGRLDEPAGELAALLRAEGETVVIVTTGPAYQALAADHYELDPAQPEALVRLLKEFTGLPTSVSRFPPVGGIVYLWALETPPDDGLAPPDQSQALNCVGAIHLVQALARTGWRDAPRLWLVTRGAQAAMPDDRALAVGQAPVWGLGRTIAYEHPELDCTLVDLDSDGGPGEAQALLRELRLADGEHEVALRAGMRCVARLTNWTAEASAPALAPAGERPFRLEINRPGTLDGLTLRATARRSPGPGEVEIAVEAAGLNFLDVLLALGAIPDDARDADGAGPRLGGECAGHVVALGAGVSDLVVGQAVVALAPWSFGRFVTTRRQHVVPLPDGLSCEAAAAVPSAFLTADYALRQVAQLARSERVLIHAAAGGVGLAAVQIAQQLGAEVFATAGSPAKRALLQSLGVAHVADSRSLAFVEAFRAATGGEGVDVVLNSLAGPFIPASLELLRPYGRFVELGKRDYYADRPLPARPFLRNLSFALVDLRGLAHERPARLQVLFRELMARFGRGELHPVPTTVVPIAEAAAAFRTMAQAQHIGKIVVSLKDAAQTPIAPATGTPGIPVQPGRTYLITGGLGALGLKVAEWLVTQGARHLALLGRSAPSEAAAQAVETLRARGVQVLVLQADVSDAQQLAAALNRVRDEAPPLGGVIHAAAVLDDGLLLRLTPERLRRVMAPKAAGAWNLHTLTRTDPLDFFVLFSSASGLLGAPGQANYAAANAFLDAVAHYRHAQGLPALSINWGPWAEVGLAAAQANRGQRLATRGVQSLSPAQGLAILELLLASNATQVGAMPFNVRQWRQFYPKVASSPLFALLPEEESSPSSNGTASMRAALLNAAPDDRRRLLEAHLIDQIAQVLRIDRGQIDPQVPLSSIGFESLMALEYRNRLEASLGLTLPATLVWGHPTIAALAPHLAEWMGLPFEGQPVSEAIVRSGLEEPEPDMSPGIDLPLSHTLEELNQLSEDEALHALLDGDQEKGRLR